MTVTGDQLRKVLAANIRRTAEKRQLALNHLADRAMVSRSQLYDVLAGNKAPSIDWIAKISEPLGVEPWELLR